MPDSKSEESEDELPRRHTYSAQTKAEPCADAEVPRSKSYSSAATKKPPKATKFQLKSSLVVVEDDFETGLVVIGRRVEPLREADSDCEGAENKPLLESAADLDEDADESNACSPPAPPSSFRN